MFECFHCGERSVIWDCDYDAKEIRDDEDEGIVHVLHCQKCGAQIEYYIPMKGDDDEDN